MNPSMDSHASGVLHETLVGHYIQGGKHMEKHPDVNGLSPEHAHDKSRRIVSEDQYNTIDNHAKDAAVDIKKKIESNGHTISHVSWTSKPGDIEKTTKISSTQDQDASDIVVHTKEGHHYGISLKRRSAFGPNGTTVSNRSADDAVEGVSAIKTAHRNAIHNAVPGLAKLASREDRKTHIDTLSQDVKDKIKTINRNTLRDITDKMHQHITNMSPDLLSNHLTTLLHAHQTPLEKNGHTHIQHITHRSKGGGVATKSVTPSEHYSDVIKNAGKISTVRRGNTISFYGEHGNRIAAQRTKFDSMSDPSDATVKIAGTTHSL